MGSPRGAGVGVEWEGGGHRGTKLDLHLSKEHRSLWDCSEPHGLCDKEEREVLVTQFMSDSL